MFWYLGAQAILLIFLVGIEKKLRSITMQINLSKIWEQALKKQEN